MTDSIEIRLQGDTAMSAAKFASRNSSIDGRGFGKD